jgi:hypothetical protein
MSILDKLSPEYRLYFESMLPWMNEVPIGEEYFTDEMIHQLKNSVLTRYQDTGETSGMMSPFDSWYDGPMYDYFSETKGTSYSPDWDKDYKRLGTDYVPDTIAHSSRVGDPNTLYNTLGTYNYEIGPRHHSAPRRATITDRYDWNPHYTSWGWVGDSNEGRDVTTSMMAKGLFDLARGDAGGANVAEMFGNYMGHRESEGEGRDVNITIPLENQARTTPTTPSQDYTYTPEGREGYSYGL